MTDEIRKRLPGIIERIDELRDEVEKIHEAEVAECQERREEMDRVAQLDAARKAEQLYGTYVSLDDASRLLANY